MAKTLPSVKSLKLTNRDDTYPTPPNPSPPSRVSVDGKQGNDLIIRSPAPPGSLPAIFSPGPVSLWPRPSCSGVSNGPCCCHR